nr:MAG TPA: SHIKIMATE KINASE KINASE, PHOSPHORYL TRANSFER, ADP.9A [Caudoviricetes sp.]
MSAILVSAFPGMGKSFAFNELKDKIKVLDSDSSKFDKSDFPSNYIEHIKNNIKDNDIIFISSHKEVRDALERENINFDLFYPSKDRRNEFLENYVIRHNNRDFIMKIDKNWNEWIDEIDKSENKNCYKHCIHGKGNFISNNEMIQSFVKQVLEKKLDEQSR